jgi:hypothetical protein
VSFEEWGESFEEREWIVKKSQGPHIFSKCVGNPWLVVCEGGSVGLKVARSWRRAEGLGPWYWRGGIGGHKSHKGPSGQSGPGPEPTGWGGDWPGGLPKKHAPPPNPLVLRGKDKPWPLRGFLHGFSFQV